MEEKNLNAKESLELIAQMIQNSKKNLEVGRGNQFLLWGWLGAIVSIAVVCMIAWSDNYSWNWLWFAIPGIGWPIMMWQLRNEKKRVLTYVDKAMKAIWISIGSIGMLTIFALAIYANNMRIILPGTLLMTAMGVVITARILSDKYMERCAGFALGLVIASSVRFVNGDFSSLWCFDYFVFSVCFIILLVLPGYHLNKEAKQSVKKISVDEAIKH